MDNRSALARRVWEVLSKSGNWEVCENAENETVWLCVNRLELMDGPGEVGNTRKMQMGDAHENKTYRRQAGELRSDSWALQKELRR